MADIGKERELYSAIWEMLNTCSDTHAHTQHRIKKNRKKKRWIGNVRIKAQAEEDRERNGNAGFKNFVNI